MKKNLLFVVVLVAAVALLASCKKKEISMTPETTKVSGDLSACFEVVDEPVKVALKDGKLEVFGSVWTVKLRRTDADFPFDDDCVIDAYGTFYTGKPVHSYCLVGFGLKITDADGNIVQKNEATEGGMGGPYSSDDVEDLFKLKPGEVGEIRWSVDDRCQDAKAPLKFTISSAYHFVEGSGEDTWTSDDESGSADANHKSGSEDVDALLDQFENTINRLSKMNWLDDNYDAVEKKALNLYEKLLDMDMTPAQEKRFDKLDDKFDEA